MFNVAVSSAWQRATSASGRAANCARCTPTDGELRATCNVKLALIKASIFAVSAFMGESSVFIRNTTAQRRNN